jgi:hypothetical protein
VQSWPTNGACIDKDGKDSFRCSHDASPRARGCWRRRARISFLAHNEVVRFLRWWLTASVAIAVALPVIAIVVALVARVSLSATLAPVAEIEFWWGIFLWLPLTAIGLLVGLIVRATRFLPWVTPDT